MRDGAAASPQPSPRTTAPSVHRRRWRPAAPHARRVRRPARAQGAPRRSSSRRPAAGARPSTTSCSPARPGSARRRLAGIVAAEMGVGHPRHLGPGLERAGDLAAILTQLGEGDVLFIDEIHRLPRAVEEVLYPAMEDFQLDIVLGKGPAARSIRLDLPRFTLVGATTRTGLITGPLRDRFGLVARLDYYDAERARGHRHPGRRHPRRATSTPTAPARSPAGPGARPASPTACCAGCATSPRCGATAPSTTPPRPPAWPLFGVDELGLDKVDRAILVGHLRAVRRRAGRACRPWPSAWASRPRPSRTSTSRSSSSRACSCAPRVGGSPPPAAWPTSGSPAPRHVARRGRPARPVRLIGASADSPRRPARDTGRRPWTPPPSTTTCPQEAHRPDTRSSPATRPGCWSTTGPGAAAAARARPRPARRCSGPATWSW